MYHFYSGVIFKIIFENKIKQLKFVNAMKFIDSYTFREVNKNNMFRNAFNG